MCRSDHASFYDPEWDIRESEKIILRRDLEEELADSINDEEWLKMSDLTNKELSTLIEENFKHIRKYFEEFIRVYRFQNQQHDDKQILLKIHNCQCYSRELKDRFSTEEKDAN